MMSIICHKYLSIVYTIPAVCNTGPLYIQSRVNISCNLSDDGKCVPFINHFISTATVNWDYNNASYTITRIIRQGGQYDALFFSHAASIHENHLLAIITRTTNLRDSHGCTGNYVIGLNEAYFITIMWSRNHSEPTRSILSP